MAILRDIRRKRPVAEELHSPAYGRLAALDEVPDEMFAGRALGDGFAVEPSDGLFRAPIAGELIVVAHTRHAFAVRSAAGAEVLVHIGVDTVMLQGEGFTALRAVGEHVELGDPIIACDLDRVAADAFSMLTSVIVTNGDVFGIGSCDLTAAPGRPVVEVGRR